MPDPTPPSSSDADEKISISAIVFLALSLIAIIDAFTTSELIHDAALVLVVVFLMFETHRVPPVQRYVGLGLGIVGMGIAYSSGQALNTLLDGLSRSITFLLLFFAVSWLRRPAQASQTLNQTRIAVMGQPPGRRFTILASAAHVLGAFLNLAGLTLLSEMVARQKDDRVRARLAVGLMMGFTSASAWSPFYVSVVVILTALPNVEWSDIALPGILVGACIVISASTLNNLIRRRRKGPFPPPPKLTRSEVRDLCLILGGLMVGVVGTVEVLNLPIPVVLALFAPVFSIVWMHRIKGPGTPIMALPRRVVAGLPSLRGESLIFVGANIFGVGVASGIDAEALAALLNTSAWSDFLKILLLSFYMVIAGAVGVHPVVLVILVGAILPPELYGLPPEVMAVTMLGCWGISTTSSPFSATTLFVSRVTGDNIFRLAWKWASPFSAVGALVVSLVSWTLWQVGVIPVSPWTG